MRLKNPYIKKMLKTYPRLRKGEEFFLWIHCTESRKLFIYRLMFISATSPVVLYIYNYFGPGY